MMSLKLHMGQLMGSLLPLLFLSAGLAAGQPDGERSSALIKNVLVNGVKLHYLEKGSGIPVVLIHGGLGDYREWNPQIERISSHYRVIAYSRRYNYPNNNAEIPPDHSAIVEARDLAALLDELKRERVPYRRLLLWRPNGAVLCNGTSRAGAQFDAGGASHFRVAVRNSGRADRTGQICANDVETSGGSIPTRRSRGGAADHVRLFQRHRIIRSDADRVQAVPHGQHRRMEGSHHLARCVPNAKPRRRSKAQASDIADYWRENSGSVANDQRRFESPAAQCEKGHRPRCDS
jgi:pimeloyl-ACP methyl ester carboxylesterase